MTAHHLDDLHPAVRPGRRARTLNDLGDIAEGSVESKSVIGACDVFVDGFRDADDAQAFGRKPGGDTKSVFTTTNDKCVEFQVLNILQNLSGSIYRLAISRELLERIGARRTEISSTVPIPTAHCLAIKR